MKSPNDIAHNIVNEIDGCMSDLAEGEEIKADEMHNDPDIMSDLMGDRLFEVCNMMRTDEDIILAWEVTDILLKISHDALKKAVVEFKKGHKLL